MKQLEQAILSTLSYHDLFNYPLKLKEVKEFLIDQQASEEEIAKVLFSLKKRKKVFQKDQFYFLPSKNENQKKNRKKIVKLRKQREKHSQEKIVIAKRIVKWLKPFSWVKMIAITGALAMNNSDQEDDIDFLVITDKNRLWLTRMIMILFLEILGKRRRPKSKDFKNKICLNMFLDQSRLSLDKKRQNLFTAHEICQMKVILNKDKTHERFLSSNLWVRKYLSNAVKVEKDNLGLKKDNLKTNNKDFSKFSFLDSLNQTAFKLQSKYMAPKKTKEEVDLYLAFFHPQNRSSQVLKKYKEKSKVFS